MRRGRCPDCTLERRRRRIAKGRADEAERLQRIAAAAPPAHTIDGQLQRHRDRREDYDVVWSGAKERRGEAMSLVSGEFQKKGTT